MDLFKQVKLRKLLSSNKTIIIFTLIYFIFCSLYITFPLIFHMSDIFFEKVDDAYISWIINWNIHSFTTNVLNIFNGNIYYPYHNTLAYADTFITSSLLAFLPVKIISEPAVAYNFNLIFSFTTLGFCTYLLALYLTKSHLSSIAAGTITAYSPYALTKVMHLQLLEICWVPLSILFFLLFLDKKSFKYFLFSVVFFVIQMYNSFLPGYFILISCLFIFIYYFWAKKIKPAQLPLGKIFLTGLVTFLLVLPTIIPYYQVSKEFNYVRDIRDAIRFANRPEYTLYPGFTTRLGDFLMSVFYKNDKSPITYDGFMGLVFFILSAVAIIYRLANRKKKWFIFDIFLTIGVFSYILSLGPAFQWGGHVIKHPFIIPLPYALFYYLVPGFNGFRNSARWEMLFLLSFSISIAYFLSVVLKDRSIIFKLFFIILICFGVLWEFNFPYKSYQVPIKENFPRIYYFIKNLPQDSVISEFPIYNWNTYPLLNSENFREYYGTLSFRKTINGASGFSPPPWQIKINYLVNNFPNSDSIKLLKSGGVNYIIVHSWEYDRLHGAGYEVSPGAEIKSKLDNNKIVEFVYSVDDDYVYKIK